MIRFLIIAPILAVLIIAGLSYYLYNKSLLNKPSVVSQKSTFSIFGNAIKDPQLKQMVQLNADVKDVIARMREDWEMMRQQRHDIEEKIRAQQYIIQNQKENLNQIKEGLTALAQSGINTASLNEIVNDLDAKAKLIIENSVQKIHENDPFWVQLDNFDKHLQDVETAKEPAQFQATRDRIADLQTRMQALDDSRQRFYDQMTLMRDRSRNAMDAYNDRIQSFQENMAITDDPQLKEKVDQLVMKQKELMENLREQRRNFDEVSKSMAERIADYKQRMEIFMQQTRLKNQEARIKAQEQKIQIEEKVQDQQQRTKDQQQMMKERMQDQMQRLKDMRNQ